VGCVGGDDFGRRLAGGLIADGVDVAHVRVDAASASGTALITVDPHGQNTIVVAPGANWRLTPEDVARAATLIADSAILLLQLEVPIGAVLAASRIARDHGVRVVLDPAPAPAEPLPGELYRLVDVLNPNEGEAEALSAAAVPDAPAAGAAAEELLRRGTRAVVIKLGARGAYVHDGTRSEVVPGIRVDAVDTTAAGDAFAGALAVALAEGKALIGAVYFANAAAALSVTRRGAQPSMPFRAEVEAFARAHLSR